MPRDAGQTGASEIINFFQRIRQRLHGGEGFPARDRPFDARSSTDDPLAALEEAEGRDALICVPRERCRGLMPLAFPLSAEAAHPYILTARAYITTGATAYAGSWLEAYHRQVRPATAAEVLGVSGELPRALRGPPTRASVLPWEGRPGRKAQRRILRQMRKDLCKHGLADAADAVWHEIGGPVPPSVGELEVRRLRELVDSIRASGFTEDPGPGTPITGTVLIDETRAGNRTTRIRIDGGQHRAATLAALEYERIPVLLRPGRVVHRNRVDSWPAVKARALDRKQALAIFDRIMEGRQPEFMLGTWPPR